MDSVTQFALGASVAHAIVGKKTGKKALLIGGVLGTIPDLDVLINFGDAIDNFTMHRGFSHSFLVLCIIAVGIHFMGSRLAYREKRANTRWLFCILACFVTHVLLDALTVYGTQLFWPLPSPPVSISSVFIIDPLYTIWLLAACGLVAFRKKYSQSVKMTTSALVLSSFYLVFSLAAKNYAESHMKTRFEERGVKVDELISIATPFNTLVWRGLVKSGEDIYEVYFSIPSARTYPISKVANKPSLSAQIADSHFYKRLDWFTHGFVSIDIVDSKVVEYADGGEVNQSEPKRVVLRDLRMGSHPDYFFSFDIGSVTEEGRFLEAKESQRLAVSRDIDSALRLLKATLFGEDLL